MIVSVKPYLIPLLSMLGLLTPAFAAPGPTTQRVPAANGWNASTFDYERPEELTIERTTPTEAQVNFRTRPPQTAEEPAELNVDAAVAKPRRVGDLDIVRLRFRHKEKETVTALLCTPAGKSGPFPLVIAVHGLNSNKAQVCAQVAPALAKQGFAVLAPDMPMHGERAGRPRALFEQRDFVGALRRHRQSVLDVRQSIDVAETLPEVDVSRGVVLVGYSMGSWINSIAGAADVRVRAMVLMVGGAHDLSQARIFPQLSAADARFALANFAPRPVLMLNAKRDAIVTPEMAERLFAGANEPKELRWYDTGHLLPAKAYDDAAKWIAKTWSALNVAAVKP